MILFSILQLRPFELKKNRNDAKLSGHSSVPPDCDVTGSKMAAYDAWSATMIN